MKVLYHASSQQNLKYIDPNKNITNHNNEKHKKVYASTDKSYSSAFSFSWSDSEGFRYGRYSDNSQWELKVPPKYASRLNHPCSIYEVEEKGFIDENLSTPEYSSKTKVKVISEEKYETAVECMRRNGVKISILRRKPFMDNALVKKFKDIIEKKLQRNV